MKARSVFSWCLIVFLASTFSSRATPPAGYALQWSDEFTGNTLNTKYWTFNREGWRNSAFNTNTAVSVTNGCLVITTYTEGGTNFTGFIATAGLVTNTYGYYEASIQFSNAPGQWSAFWLQSPYINDSNATPTNGVEIDIFEHRDVDYYGNNWVNGGDNALHWDGYGTNEQSAEWSSKNIGVANGFHTYGFLWATNSYTFYVDGNVTWTTTQYPISTVAQYIDLTSEVESNSWAGNVPATNYPSLATSQIKMYVDYVRYYVALTLPVITQDLPGRVALAAGRSYTYSIGANGAPPLHYQWYQESTPLAGQTNTAYALTAGSPGSSNTYSVVITNVHGAITSSVSTLTVIAAPKLTNFYAAAVLSNGPVGYWPLQETTAPAPVNMETNYGTLGKLGNAYYAATNAAGVSFNQTGALTSSGDNDPAVGFSLSTSATTTDFAFVPRVTPALTVQPPFTLEAWVNSTTTGFDDFLGEGGSGFDAPPNSGNFGGVRVSWSGSGPVIQAYVFTGSGGTKSSCITPTIPKGQWDYIVITYSSSEETVYVNGVSDASVAVVMAPDTWSPFTIGDGFWQGFAIRPYVGKEDEVAAYTNILTPAQIANHWLAATTPGSNYMQTVLSDNPLLYYRMDNPAFITPNPATYPVATNFGSSPLSGVYPSGIAPGGVSGPPIVALGASSVAAPINGVFSCVDAGYDPGFNSTNGQPFTAMIWFRTYPADGRMQTIMSHGGNTSWSINLVGTNGLLNWNSGAGSVNSTKVLNDGNWHFVAGVYNGSYNYLYVDGALNNSTPATGSVAGNTSDDVFLGGDPDHTQVGSGGYYFAGAIAQAAFFTNALTGAQMQTIYQAAGTLPPENFTIQNTGGNQVQLNWSYGTLQCATNVAGPYNDLGNATSPYTITATNDQQFYRVREN